jgi:hypothetical protein
MFSIEKYPFENVNPSKMKSMRKGIRFKRFTGIQLHRGMPVAEKLY